MIKTAFSEIHPAVQALYIAIVTLMAMLLFHLIFYAVAIFILVIVVISQGMSSTLVKRTPLLLLSACIIIVLNPLFNHRGMHIIGYFMDEPITLEALLYGVTMALLMTLIYLVFLLFHFWVSPARFLYLFARFSPQAALVVMMAVRFVPLFLRRLQTIRTTQLLRHHGQSKQQGRWQHARSLLYQLQVLLSWSLEAALQSADSMRARGYGVTARTSYRRYRITRTDLVLTGFILASAALLLWGWMLGYGTYAIYPWMSKLTFHRMDWIMFAVFLSLLLLPLILEGKEKLSWSTWKYRTSALPTQNKRHPL